MAVRISQIIREINVFQFQVSVNYFMSSSKRQIITVNMVVFNFCSCFYSFCNFSGGYKYVP